MNRNTIIMLVVGLVIVIGLFALFGRSSSTSTTADRPASTTTATTPATPPASPAPAPANR